jgi:hypothetical protein
MNYNLKTGYDMYPSRDRSGVIVNIWAREATSGSCSVDCLMFDDDYCQDCEHYESDAVIDKIDFNFSIPNGNLAKNFNHISKSNILNSQAHLIKRLLYDEIKKQNSFKDDIDDMVKCILKDLEIYID